MQGDLTGHWSAAVFGEQSVDVFHDSRLEVCQLHVSTAETTPEQGQEQHHSGAALKLRLCHMTFT